MRQSNTEFLQYLADKMDMLDHRLDEMDKTLIKQELQLAEHMRRTALLEDELKPIKTDRDRAYFVAKLVASIGTFVAFCAGLWQFVKGGK